MEKLNISELNRMDEAFKQTLLRTASSIIEKNKNNTITELDFSDNGGSTAVGKMLLQSLANSNITNINDKQEQQ